MAASAGERVGDRGRAAGLWTLAGLAVAGIVALALFVGPEWSEYRFYNWQMSVTRKPSYDAQSLLNRVSWFPVLHDVLSRMWVVVALGLAAFVARALDWFRRPPAEQLLVLWVGVGVLELLLHDVGNERRFVFLIPAFTALAALAIASDRAIVPDWLAPLRGWRRLLFVPLALYAAYVVSGSLVRLAFLYDVRPAVRGGAALALAAVAAAWIFRQRLTAAARQPWTPAAAVIVVAILAAGGAGQFVQFAAGRSYKNVEASRELGRRLPPGTLVHGKLANGLALENRIRPIFVGRQFGNYADRLTRNDVPWLLTYVAPRTGYEGPVILDVLAAYPEHRTVWTFDVAETTSGQDRAALIAKGPPAAPVPLEAKLRETDRLSRHQGPRRPALPLGVRLRPLRVLPQRQGLRVPRPVRCAPRGSGPRHGVRRRRDAAVVRRGNHLGRRHRPDRSLPRRRHAAGRREEPAQHRVPAGGRDARCRSRRAASTWCSRTR